MASTSVGSSSSDVRGRDLELEGEMAKRSGRRLEWVSLVRTLDRQRRVALRVNAWSTLGLFLALSPLAAQQSDLIVQSMSVSPSSGLAGSGATVSVTLRNQGSGTAAASTTGLRIQSVLDERLDLRCHPRKRQRPVDRRGRVLHLEHQCDHPGQPSLGDQLHLGHRRCQQHRQPEQRVKRPWLDNLFRPERPSAGGSHCAEHVGQPVERAARNRRHRYVDVAQSGVGHRIFLDHQAAYQPVLLKCLDVGCNPRGRQRPVDRRGRVLHLEHQCDHPGQPSLGDQLHLGHRRCSTAPPTRATSQTTVARQPFPSRAPLSSRISLCRACRSTRRAGSPEPAPPLR